MGFGKAVANMFLDEYIRITKKTGNTSSRESAEFLKDYVNGKKDSNGNPIRRYDDDDED